MKVTRYSASGTTQSNGADTTSVARCCVTPSSNADGTSASTIQSARVRVRIGSGSGVPRARPCRCAARARRRHARVRARSHKPGDDPERRRPAGHLNAARGDRLRRADSPAAPAGFRRCSPRRESTGPWLWDRWSSRTIAAEAGPWRRARRRADPTVLAKVRSSHRRGSAPPGSPTPIGMGSRTLATISTPTWIGRCQRRATRVLSAWA